MAVLNPNIVARDVEKLLDFFGESQWKHRPDFKYASTLQLMTKETLRNLKMEKGLYVSRTSGSTGEPVTVQKTYLDYIWSMATNIREIRWRKWDVTKSHAAISGNYKETDLDSWGIPRNIAPVQGKGFLNDNLPISVLQAWLEKKNPHYLSAFPSIVSQLDLSKLTNLIDYKGTGEAGGTMYSCEECGTIAIQCPDNPAVMHVMENLIVEVDNDGCLIITSLTNPYIKRYKMGDYIELGDCHCGRTLQTITTIKGRVRNMFVLPNGDKRWPTIGSKLYYEQFGIKRYKAIQTSLDNIDLYIICERLGERENELVALVQQWLDSSIEVTIKYVDDFPNYKFEEFVSLIT